MACQSKTFINDLGSDVVAEITSQLNTALSVTPLQVLRQPTATGGTGVADVATVANDANISGVLFTAPEDCFVTSVKFGGLTTVALNVGTPANTLVILVRVPAVWTDGTPTTGIDQLFRPAGIHGNVGGTGLGANAASTYDVVFATTGTALTAAAGFDFDQVGELVGLVATGGAAGILGADVGGTMVAQACGNSGAVSIPAAGFNMNAGDSLVWMFHSRLGGGVNCALVGAVGYRPVKDSMTLSPAQTVTAFNSVNR